jgi:hypothetical protein
MGEFKRLLPALILSGYLDVVAGLTSEQNSLIHFRTKVAISLYMII